jgi:hypothetical protein
VWPFLAYIVYGMYFSDFIKVGNDRSSEQFATGVHRNILSAVSTFGNMKIKPFDDISEDNLKVFQGSPSHWLM